jgi:hypothetical protein
MSQIRLRLASRWISGDPVLIDSNFISQLPRPHSSRSALPHRTQGARCQLNGAPRSRSLPTRRSELGVS